MKTLPIKICLLGILSLLLPLGCLSASGEEQCMLLTFKDGRTVSIPLLDEDGEPIEIFISDPSEWMPVEYDENNVEVSIGGTFYLFADLSRYTFTAPSTVDLRQPLVTTACPEFRLSGNRITISRIGDSKLPSVAVYNMNGTKIAVEQWVDDDRLIVDISHVVPGIYIVSFENHSFKFKKR